MEAHILIKKNLAQIAKKITKEEVNVELSIPEVSENGDYSTNLALKLAGSIKKSPGEIADIIQREYKKLSGNNISKIEIAGPGFINFFLSREYLRECLVRVISEKEDFGKSKLNRGRKAVVEYSSPNIAKPFTVGHLRSTIIGASIANLMEATGWEIYRDNHIGDWGTQFGKQIYAIKEWGDEKKIDKSENPVKELVDLYVRFHKEAEGNPKLEDEGRAWFKKLEEGNPEARRIWQKCVDWSMREFVRLYDLLGVRFSENGGQGYGEAFFEDKMGLVISELRTKNLLKKHEGAELVYFHDDKYPPLMILKRDEASLYSTRDLATDKFRLELHGKDTVIINEVGVEQSLYFEQLFEVEKMLGWVKEGQRVHVKHGHFRFKEGKMSTRKGNVVWLEDILSEAKKRAASLSKGTGQDSATVATGAVKWNDLKRNSIQDIVFDWDDILNMEGNSGPYMQYTYVRTQSILKKIDRSFTEGNIKLASNLEKEEEELLRKLVHFPETIILASESLSPSFVASYLFDLAQKFNFFYQKYRVLSENDLELRTFRIALTAAVGQTIGNGLALLGIETVERM